jgi:hypothetical protein
MPVLVFCQEAARRSVRAWFAVLAAVFVLSLIAASAASAAGARPLVLEEFFQGRTVGEGVFVSDFAGVRRPFTVVTRGTWNAKTFTLRLREDFRYADGERDTKVWFFQKVAADRYIASRSDVLTPVNIRSGGSRLRFDYPATVETANGPVALRFCDTLTQVDRKTVRNTANVMKYGFVIGTVEVTFHKP